MIGVDLIFFDIDGTLVNANRDIVNAVNYTRKQFTLEPKPLDEIVSYIGTGVSDLVNNGIIEDSGLQPKDVLAVFEKYYLRHATDYARLYPNAKSVLRYFRDKKKVILTNRYKKFAVAALKRFDLMGYFIEIIGGDNENCMKPFACVVEKSLKKHKADRSRSIIIGDMAIDVETGKNAGIKTCFITYGLGKLKDVKKLKPDYIIDDLSELKGIIE